MLNYSFDRSPTCRWRPAEIDYRLSPHVLARKPLAHRATEFKMDHFKSESSFCNGNVSSIIKNKWLIINFKSMMHHLCKQKTCMWMHGALWDSLHHHHLCPPHHQRTSNRGHGYQEHQEQHNSLLELVHNTVSYIITGLWSWTQLRLILTFLTGFSFHLCVHLCEGPKQLPSEQRQAAVRHSSMRESGWVSS